MTGSLDRHVLDKALRELGAVLEEDGQHIELCIIGGAAFVLQGTPGFVSTADLDITAQVLDDGSIVAPVPLPASLMDAIAIVAESFGLPPHWINGAAAASFGILMPPGFLDRAHTVSHGGLVLHVADRFDLVHLKLQAALRRGYKGERHRDDLLRAQPSDAELESARSWLLDRASDPVAAEPRILEVIAHVRERRDG
jgi:hypothetical protein